MALCAPACPPHPAFDSFRALLVGTGVDPVVWQRALTLVLLW